MTGLPLALSRKRKARLALVAVLTLGQGVVGGAAAFATRGLFDAMHRGADLPLVLLGGLVVSGCSMGAFRVLARRQGEALGQEYAQELRVALFDHAARMPVSSVAERRSGYMSLRFVGDMTAFRNWLGLGVPRLIAAMVLVPCAMAALAVLSVPIAIAVAPVITIGFVGIALFGRRLVPLHRKLRQKRGRIAAEMAERMPLAPHLDVLGRRSREAQRLRKNTRRMVDVALQRITLAEAIKALPDALAGLAAAMIIVTGFRVDATPGTIAGALAALGLILQPMRDLGSVWNLRAAYTAAQEKVQVALQRKQRPEIVTRQSLPKGAFGLIVTSLPMPSGRALTFRIGKGKHKTLYLEEMDCFALFDRIQRLDACAPGQIQMGGRDIHHVSPGNLRRRVVRLGGDSLILQGTLRQALMLGVDHDCDDATLGALALAEGLGPTLERLGGLQGRVCEGARNLNQRERLLISIVRARLQSPGLVLLTPAACHAHADIQMRVSLFINETGATVLRCASENISAELFDMVGADKDKVFG